MAKTTVKIDSMAATITEALKEYAETVEVDLFEMQDEVAAEAVKELKNTTAVGGKKYKKSWAKKVTTQTSHHKVVTVYNKSEYQLTHLLENGHANVRGGRTIMPPTPAHPHILDAQEHAEDKLIKKIKGAI